MTRLAVLVKLRKTSFFLFPVFVSFRSRDKAGLQCWKCGDTDAHQRERSEVNICVVCKKKKQTFVLVSIYAAIIQTRVYRQSSILERLNFRYNISCHVSVCGLPSLLFFSPPVNSDGPQPRGAAEAAAGGEDLQGVHGQTGVHRLHPLWSSGGVWRLCCQPASLPHLQSCH